MTNYSRGDWGFDETAASRKRKTYDRDIDDRDRYGRAGLGFGRFGGGVDRFGDPFGLEGPFDRAGFGLLADRFGGGPFERDRSLFDDLRFGMPRGFVDRGLDWPGRRGLDLGDTSYYTGLGRPQPIGLLQQRPQAIGEAGYDLGITGRRRADEGRYRNMRDWDRVEENPNIDDLTLWRPRADIFDQGADSLRVEFELPGVPREDISLTARDNVITLAALKPQSRKEEAGLYYQNERHFGKFYRRLTLPFSVDPNSVRAHLELGVLKVHLYKVDGTSAERVPIAEGATVGITTPATTTSGASISGSRS
jgi:HSP20 family protein